MTRLNALCLIVGLLLPELSAAQLNIDQALDRVKNLQCHGETVESHLNRTIKPSHRDLGWQVFKHEDLFFDVERSFLVSKSMEIRYRWRIQQDGILEAVSERAQKLCS